MADLSVAKNALEEFKCQANDAIQFKLVRNKEDAHDDKKNFHPDMTHQVFGDSETIFGYKGMKVSLYFTAAKLIPYFNLSWTQMCDVAVHGVPPDDVQKILLEEIPEGHLTNMDTFLAAVDTEQDFVPYGEMIDSYTVSTDCETRQFEVYFTKIETPGFRDFHSRLQSFIKFYIDAASYIDVDDSLWDYFLLFEKYVESGEKKYAVAGYMTVYNFFAYPSRIRPRISQLLVLPPFQKMGLAARLIQTFYNTCYSRPEVLDITVEDPSENFQRVRDYVDAKNCQKLSSFQPEELHKGFSQDMLHEARTKLRLSKLQTRRVYEILRLKATNRDDKESFRAFRLEVKRRLNLPFLKNRRTYQKLEKTLNPEELSQTLGLLKNEQKFQFLENAFQDDMVVYTHVLTRLERS